MDLYKAVMIENVDRHIMETESPTLDRGDFMNMVCRTINSKMEQTWRVKLLDNGFIRLDSFSLIQKNLPASECLNDITELPQWIQERLAVLQICEQGTILDGVGQKVSSKVYYVIE